MGGGGGGVDIKDSEDQKMMAQVAKEKWRMYQAKFVPQENMWMEDLSNQNDEKHYLKASGIANTATNNAYGHAMQQLIGQGGNQGRMNAGINDVAVGEHKTRMDNTNRMQVNQQGRYIQGLQNINQLGMGKEAQAMSSMHDAASISNSYAQNEAQNKYHDNASKNELIGMGIGAASRYGMGQL